eukprot:4723766-Pyramimonas_sp.AAC.1
MHNNIHQTRRKAGNPLRIDLDLIPRSDWTGIQSACYKKQDRVQNGWVSSGHGWPGHKYRLPIWIS